MEPVYTFLTPTHTQYFDKMKAGEVIDVWKARYPLHLIWAAREYIEQHTELSNGQLEFNNDYTEIKKLQPWK